jgi:cytochrome c biogenesis protein
MRSTDKSQTVTPLRYFWRFFTSIRLALVLIFIIIFLSIVSIFLIQAPQGITYGTTDYQAWLEVVIRPDFSIWTDILGFFGLFDVFRSPLFLGAGILLVFNILCCSMSRLAAVKVALRGISISTAASSFENTPIIIQTKSSASNSVLSITNVLLRHKYRVQTKESGGMVFFAADKYAFSRLGTMISHLSLILLVVGFLLGSFLGFQDDAFILAEGTMREVGHDTGLILGLVAFKADYWPDGTPREYRSDVVVYENGKQIETATVRVNHPLSYNGIRFYQSFFGQAATMQVQTIEGVEVVDSNVALVGMMNVEPFQRPLGKLDLPGTGLTAYLVAPTINMVDPILKAGQLGIEIYEDEATVPVEWAILDIGVMQQMQGLEFTYVEQSSFSGFSVKYDPGNWLVWLAFGLLFVGVSVVLYLPYRNIQAMVKKGEEANSIYYLRAWGRRRFDANAEIKRLANEMVSITDRQADTIKTGEKADG